MDIFNIRKNLVLSNYETLITRHNIPIDGNGVYTRYAHPVVTAEMVPHSGNMTSIRRPTPISWSVSA